MGRTLAFTRLGMSARARHAKSRRMSSESPPRTADLASASRPARFDEAAPRPVPALELQDGSTLPRLVAVMQRLLAPDGCPWDREQSFETLRKYALEEACEVIDAID